MAENEEFDKVESGASHCYPVQVGNLHKGDTAMLKGKPCRVMEITCAKTGKHGHAKASITGIDVFTGKKCEDSYPTSHNIDAPFIVRKEYQLVNIDPDDGFVTLLNEKGVTRSDLKLPTEECFAAVTHKAKEYFNAGKEILAQVMEACGEEHIIDVKEMVAGTDLKK